MLTALLAAGYTLFSLFHYYIFKTLLFGLVIFDLSVRSSALPTRSLYYVQHARWVQPRLLRPRQPLVAGAAALNSHAAPFVPVLPAVALERVQAGRLRSALIELAALLLVMEDMGGTSRCAEAA